MADQAQTPGAGENLSMSATPTPLEDLRSVAAELADKWDAGMRAGKLLAHLEGRLQSYDPRVSRIVAALAAQQPKEGGASAGWKLVPEEVLKPFVTLAAEVEQVAKECGVHPDGVSKSCAWEDLLRLRYALAAAPTPPAREDGGGEKTYPYSEPKEWPHWYCPECQGKNFAGVFEKKPSGQFGLGPLIRCTECKQTFDTRPPTEGAHAPTAQPDDLGKLSAGEEPPAIWIRRAIMANLKGEADGVDDAVAVIVANLPAPAAPQATEEPVAWEAPDGWVLIPEHPLPEMMGAFWRTKNTGTTELGGAYEDNSDVAAFRAYAAAAPAASRIGVSEEEIRDTARTALVECGFGNEPIEGAVGRTARAIRALFASSQVGCETGAARDVLCERRRQIEVEGWTPQHDDAHHRGEMARAAGCYALLAGDYVPPITTAWPWSSEWWKPSLSPRHMLVKAAALILAEIERLDRCSVPASGNVHLDRVQSLPKHREQHGPEAVLQRNIDRREATATEGVDGRPD